MGGGITQDITGYLASTLYRGVRWVYAPTTLLAMADSCIGGKTSLNHGARKNLLGTMYPPERVLVHADFVSTLCDADYSSGLGEVVKLHLLGGQDSVDELREALPALLAREAGAVRRATRASLHIKRDFIEEDEFPAAWLAGSTKYPPLLSLLVLERVKRMACLMTPAATSSYRTSPGKMGNPAASAEVQPQGR